MNKKYVHGYTVRENVRLVDQATTLADILQSDTVYPAGSNVLEAGCGVVCGGHVRECCLQCVEVCPTGSRVFGNVRDPESPIN